MDYTKANQRRGRIGRFCSWAPAYFHVVGTTQEETAWGTGRDSQSKYTVDFNRRINIIPIRSLMIPSISPGCVMESCLQSLNS